MCLFIRSELYFVRKIEKRGNLCKISFYVSLSALQSHVNSKKEQSGQCKPMRAREKNGYFLYDFQDHIIRTILFSTIREGK